MEVFSLAKLFVDAGHDVAVSNSRALHTAELRARLAT
jgi:hypothetical protein